jgi:hypothetical protein
VKENFYKFVANKRIMGKSEQASDEDTTGNKSLNFYSKDNVERITYMLEMLDKFPNLRKVVEEDYSLRNQKSRFNVNKV